jgi:hypothetical protein
MHIYLIQMEVSHLEGEPGAVNVSLSDASLATTEVPAAKTIHYKPTAKRPRYAFPCPIRLL